MMRTSFEAFEDEIRPLVLVGGPPVKRRPRSWRSTAARMPRDREPWLARMWAALTATAPYGRAPATAKRYSQ